ncbi:hypothetical protein [Novosphingobium sp. 9U]|uniref:hypothetical protein n=1 Tax=Novosphingobium sp. 9U TaxID=2653158 RepID=UPI0012F0A37A|nr:hypothetical protein [Novosphingobium sp. 9U]VWX47255.1 conserved exported hypothetical protein [Novosphingobium sp. 9U]
MIKPAVAAVCLAILLLAGSAQAQSNLWFGTWKLRPNDASEKPETLIYSDAGDGAMKMVSVEQQSIIITHLDGKRAADVGPGNRQGASLAVKATSPTSYDWTFFKDGKPFVQGRNTLAADLKSFNEVSWLVTRPSDVVALVYERQ